MTLRAITNALNDCRQSENPVIKWMLPFDVKNGSHIDISGIQKKCSIGHSNLAAIEELYVYFEEEITLPVGNYYETFEKKWISMPFFRKFLRLKI